MASDENPYEITSFYTELTLEELVTTNPLPQRAKVTIGYEDPYNTDNTFSTDDVIEVRVYGEGSVPTFLYRNMSK